MQNQKGSSLLVGIIITAISLIMAFGGQSFSTQKLSNQSIQNPATITNQTNNSSSTQATQPVNPTAVGPTNPAAQSDEIQNQPINTTPQTIASQTSWQTINDTVFGISVKVPKSWAKIKTPQPSMMLSFAVPGQDFVMESQALYTSYGDQLNANIALQKNIISQKQITINGNSAYEIIRGNANPSSETITVFIDGGSKFYSINWTTSTDYINNNQDTINQILGSIHFTGN